MNFVTMYQERDAALHTSQTQSSGVRLAAGEPMSQQPAKDWDEMSQQTKDEIKARLIRACETRAAVDLAHTPRDLTAKLLRSAD